MDIQLFGAALSAVSGLNRDNAPPRTVREEDQFYERFGNGWALPFWITGLPALLRRIGARAAEYLRSVRTI